MTSAASRAQPTTSAEGSYPDGVRGDEVHPQLRAGDHERVADVVAVAEVGDADAVEPAQLLADRHHVGDRLAGVELVGEPVDDGDVGVLGELVDVGLLERADHDPVEVAGEHHRGVLDRLAAAELQVAGGEVEARPAELRDADLEAHARARGRLLEDHPERAALEQPMRHPLALARLQPVGVVEDEHELLGRPVVDAEEVTALQVGGNHARILVIARPGLAVPDRLGAGDQRLAAGLGDEGEGGLDLRPHAPSRKLVDQRGVPLRAQLGDRVALAAVRRRSRGRRPAPG